MPDYIAYSSLVLNAGAAFYFLKLRKEVAAAKVAVDRATLALQNSQEAHEFALKVNAKVLKELEKEKGLSSLHISKNEEFEKQARDAWEMYRKAGLLASNAQVWIMRELERAVLMLNRYRQEKGEAPLKVNEELKEFVANFKREHVGETHGG